MFKGFLKKCLAVFEGRVAFFAVFNVLFFGAVFVSALTSSFMFVPPPLEEGTAPFHRDLFGGGLVLTFLGIFVSNLVLSAFLVLTLPGLFFFGLSLALLLYRAAVWGFLLAFTPTHQFVAALPTVILEGEAYVMAAVAGAVLGLSWLKPKWIFKGQDLPRREALIRAFKECFHFYVLVASILFVATIIETVTLYVLT